MITLQRLPHSRSYGSEEVGHFAAIVRCALGMWSGKVPCNLRVHHCVAPLTWSNELAQAAQPHRGNRLQHAVMRAQRGYEDASLRWKAFRRLIFARSNIRRRRPDRFFPARFM